MSTRAPERLVPAPTWTLATALLAPVALVGGWLWSGATTRGYDPVRSSVSDLAAYDAPHRWVMTAAFVVAGLALVATAVGLRPADVAGRALLGVGGGATVLMGWIPNAYVGHNSLGHMIVSYLTFASLSVWPAVIARNVPAPPAVLRQRTGQVTALLLLLLFVVLVADIVTDGTTLGLRERLLTTAQVLVPLVVAAGVVKVPGPALREPVPHG